MPSHPTITQAIVLAVVQGVTEFLPVSSTAHLMLTRALFHWTDNHGLVFDIVLHAGSLVAILVCFFQDWKKALLNQFKSWRTETFFAKLPWLLLLATLPLVCAAPRLLSFLKSSDGGRSTLTIGLSMLATGLWFWFCDRRATQSRNLKRFRWSDALWMGIAQIIALLPGASRSGWTAGTGILRQYDRASAMKFAFYMAVPAILGALILQGHEIYSTALNIDAFCVMSAGFFASFLVSLLALRLCLWFFANFSFRVFKWYLWVVGGSLVIKTLI